MDAAILANLNKVVRPQDVLYLLGDFCLGGPDPSSLSIDVLVHSHDFQPWHFVEIKTVMNAKQVETNNQ